MSARGNTAEVDEIRARPVGTAVTAVHVGKDVRSDEVADPYAGRPGVLHLLRARNSSDRVLNRTPQAAELVIAENTNDPTRADLPVVATTDSAIPARTTHSLIDAQRHARGGDAGEGVCIPEATARAAK